MQLGPKSTPCERSKWLGRIRSIAPCLATALLSVTRRARRRNDTSAWNLEMSPVASALPCALSRHHAASVIVDGLAVAFGRGSWYRNATLKNAAVLEVPPPGCEASAT